jgi:hypothetical protein
MISLVPNLRIAFVLINADDNLCEVYDHDNNEEEYDNRSDDDDAN